MKQPAQDPEGWADIAAYEAECTVIAEYDFSFNHREAIGFSDEARTEAAVRSAEGKRLTYSKSCD